MRHFVGGASSTTRMMFVLNLPVVFEHALGVEAGNAGPEPLLRRELILRSLVALSKTL
jgi:hypothetical protein